MDTTTRRFVRGATHRRPHLAAEAGVIAICAALAWEVRPVIRALRQVRRSRIAEVPVWEGDSRAGPVVVFRAGMGPARAARAAKQVLSARSPSVLLNTGCCGGLDPRLVCGDFVIPGRILDSVQDIEILTDLSWSERLRRCLPEPADAGPQVTCETVLRTAADKVAARSRYGATAVDMEGGALGHLAAERGIPFGSVRAVLDEAAHELPDISSLTGPEGDLRPLRAVGRIVRNPLEIGEFWQIKGAASVVEKRLGKFFQNLLRAQG